MNPEEAGQEEDADDFQSIAPVDKAKTGSASYQASHYISYILIIFKLGRSWTPPGLRNMFKTTYCPERLSMEQK